MSSETVKWLLVLYLTPVTAMFVRRSRRLIRKHRMYYGLIVNCRRHMSQELER